MTFSLLAEAIVWPKPGLVSAISNGIHTDMNIFTFTKSSIALNRFFYKSVLEGLKWEGKKYDNSDLFIKLRHIGLEAEEVMFQTTNGINTHKGSIFLNIILCGAAGLNYSINGDFNPINICSLAKEISIKHLKDDFNKLKGTESTGMKAYSKYGIRGVRGEVQDGFPHILQCGLPVLKECLMDGIDLRISLTHTLITLISKINDTTILNRKFNCWRIKYAQLWAKKVLDSGSVFSLSGKIMLDEMEAAFNKYSINPGGSADLLSSTLALYLWDGGNIDY